MPSCSATLRKTFLLPCDEKFFALQNSNPSRQANSANSIFGWEGSSPTLLFPPAVNFACRHHALRSSAATARLFFIKVVRFRISACQLLPHCRAASHPLSPHARESSPSAIFVPRTSRSAAKARRSFPTPTIFCIATRDLAGFPSISVVSPTSPSFHAQPRRGKSSPSTLGL